ncbi:MAG: decarboxylating 6-phosphogluconate dehydrogenase [Hydrogenophilaceae bacterium]|nr:decarboxylating 6-phosphogluconate dehydrogenase [Hydrogenophilaceae bacterium]
MQIGLYGLGRMGGNMARRLARGGVKVFAYNRSFEVTEKLAAGDSNVQACRSLEEVVSSLAAPRVLWLMLPSGPATEAAILQAAALLSPGDILVDGANGYYKEAIARSGQLSGQGIGFVDVGVSGGIWGLDNGYCLMAGGDDAAIAAVAPFLKVLAPAPDRGWLHAGPVGSGHFVKMVHNGIEYGMMQAFAEGFALMRAKTEFDLDMAEIAELWRHSSVVRSWLLDLTADFLKADQKLDAISPVVADSGEGRWTALEAVEQGVPTPVMSLALMMRFATQGKNDYAAKMLSMMRKGFGGHAVQGKGD